MMVVLKIVLALFLVSSALLVDLPQLKNENKRFQLMVYGTVTGIGILLFAVFSIRFDLPSPLGQVEQWLRPVSGWFGL